MNWRNNKREIENNKNDKLDKLYSLHLQYCSRVIKNNKNTHKQLDNYIVTILHSELSDIR